MWDFTKNKTKQYKKPIRFSRSFLCTQPMANRHGRCRGGHFCLALKGSLLRRPDFSKGRREAFFFFLNWEKNSTIHLVIIPSFGSVQEAPGILSWFLDDSHY